MRKLTCLIGVISCLVGTGVSPAAMTVSYQFVGNGNWSLDAVGSTNTPVGMVRAVVPPGSTVVKAFLYTTRYDDGATNTPIIVLDGQTYGSNSWTALGLNFGNNNLLFQAYRADVTVQMQTAIGSGSTSTNLFVVNSEDLTVDTDGEILAIVYSNSSAPLCTIAFLDGYCDVYGQTTVYDFSAPLQTGTGFQALLSLGIGHGYQVDGAQQYSIIDVDGRRLTTAAGGSWNGTEYNGGLITVGGIDDSPMNPSDPFATPTGIRTDNELYNLDQGNATNSAPFVTAGQTSVTLDTVNPSGDDTLFFMGFNITQGTGGGSNTCASTDDLLAKVDALGLDRSRTLRLERQVTIIKKSLSRNYAYGARAECRVQEKYLAALVRLGRLTPSAVDDIAACCETLTTGAGGSGSSD